MLSAWGACVCLVAVRLAFKIRQSAKTFTCHASHTQVETVLIIIERNTSLVKTKVAHCYSTLSFFPLLSRLHQPRLEALDEIAQLDLPHDHLRSVKL